MVAVDIKADLNREDDEGLNIARLRNALDPSAVRRGAVLIAGDDAAWSWVEVVYVDEDDQVHFRQITQEFAARLRRLAPAS